MGPGLHQLVGHDHDHGVECDATGAEHHFHEASEATFHCVFCQGQWSEDVEDLSVRSAATDFFIRNYRSAFVYSTSVVAAFSFSQTTRGPPC